MPATVLRRLSNSITAPNSEGQGQDFGFMVTLLGGRIHARVARYTTAAVNLTDSYGGTGIAPESVAPSILGALRSAGRITQAEQDAHTPIQNGVTFDQESKGYEFELTANLTKNWRWQANYSYTDTMQASFGPEIKAWMDREIAYGRSFNQGSLITSGSTTIDGAIAFMLDGYNDQGALGFLGEQGLRKHKVSLFTRYDFSARILKGAYVGGGYRHQSKNLAGADDTGLVGFYGKSFWRADLLAGYKFGKPTLRQAGGFLNGIIVQLNVANVFDDDGELITRIMPDGVSVRRAIVQPPRTWRLQARMDF